LFNLITIPTLLVAPAAFLFYYFWIRDKWEKEPWSLIWALFGLGCLGVIPAAIIEVAILGADTRIETVGQAFSAAFLGVALVEEGIKFVIVYLFTFRSRHFDEEYDGIVYAVAVGLGFAFLENVLYVVMALSEGPSGLITAVARALTAVPAHALDGVILGYFLGHAKFARGATDRMRLSLSGLALAVAFHGLYDLFVFILMVPDSTLVGWCIVGLVWTLFAQWGAAYRLVRAAQEHSSKRWRGAAQVTIGGIDEARPAAMNFCRFCGGKVDAGAGFCRHCGAGLG